MTQDEIIEMARQAGMDYLQYLGPEAFEKVVVFSKLVAEHEREACAKVVENILLAEGADVDDVLLRLSEDIRARGQA
jgi:hypothetical protein